jgi:hypothetical protein
MHIKYFSNIITFYLTHQVMIGEGLFLYTINYYGMENKILLTAIEINKPTRCNSFKSLLLNVYVQLKMFRASSRPSSGAQ